MRIAQVAHCDGAHLVVDPGVASRKRPVLNEAGKTTGSAGYADLRDGLRRALARSEAAFALRLGLAAAADQGDELVDPVAPSGERDC
jgi:hypothetical protein